jgi:D-alanyl-D-alanine carboxypeptidase
VWKPEELHDFAFAKPGDFAPGSDFEYSKTNYILLDLIIELSPGRPSPTQRRRTRF